MRPTEIIRRPVKKRTRRHFARGTPVDERLFAGARRTARGCLLYGGARTDGYGVLTVAGRLRRAHRVAWSLYRRRPVPPGRLVTHSCDTRPCIAREHLQLGTHATNSAEAVARGRVARGERNGRSRLTTRLVRWARRRYATGGVRLVDLAVALEVDASTVWAAVNRLTWAWLDPVPARAVA